MIHCYARVSTQDQGASLPVQLNHMMKWCGNEPHINYEEKGSGKDTDRPVLQSILSSIQKGDTLMVYDSSRLSRRTEDTLSIAKMLNDKGCFLNIGNKIIDLSNPVDKMSLSISASVDTFNREFQNLKSREGIDAKKASGDWVMRGDTIGWRTYKTRGMTKAEIDPIAAKYIRYIFEQYLTGRSVNSIAKELEDVIIPGWEHFRFTASNVERLLKKPLYAGYYTKDTGDWKRIWKMSRKEIEQLLIKSNIYEPIIDLETYWKVMDNWRSVPRKHAIQYQYRWSFYELSTIFKCPYCNTGFAHYYFKGQKGTLEKYKSLAHKKDCPDPVNRDFDKDALEMIVRVALILTFLDHDEVECFFKTEMDKAGLEKNELKTQLDNIEKMIAQNRKKQEKLLDIMMEDGIDREIFKERTSKLKEENSKLTYSKNALLTQISQFDSLIDNYYEEMTRDVLEEYGHLEPTLRRDMLKRYLKCAHVRKAGFEVEFLNGKRFETDIWAPKKKILNPLTMKVSFKGENQYSLILYFQPERKVEILDEDYGDEQTNLFFSKRNREVENRVTFWLEKFLSTDK